MGIIVTKIVPPTVTYEIPCPPRGEERGGTPLVDRFRDCFFEGFPFFCKGGGPGQPRNPPKTNISQSGGREETGIFGNTPFLPP